MTLNDVDPERFERVNMMNLKLSEMLVEILHEINKGVCEGYPDKPPFAISMIQLITVIRFSTELQTTMIEAIMYGLEEVGLMKVVPDEDVIASPEFKAMKAHFERLKKEK